MYKVIKYRFEGRHIISAESRGLHLTMAGAQNHVCREFKRNTDHQKFVFGFEEIKIRDFFKLNKNFA